VRRRPALLSALTAAALVAVALAGCAPQGRGPGNQPAGCTPDYASGDASSIVKATGSLQSQPTVTFPTPLVTKTAQVTVLKAGHGTPAVAGAPVEFEYTIYNGETGKALGGSGYSGQPGSVAAGSKLSNQDQTTGATVKTSSSIANGLVCAQAGSRIAVASTAKQLGLGSLDQYGIADSGAVVVVMDVIATFLPKADGVNQLPKDGMPNVITAVSGQPGIVVQELNKPTTVRSEVVKAGGGAVLKKNQLAVLRYTAWTWPTGGDKPTVVSDLDTWPDGANTVKLTASNGTLPAKAATALIGQRVGSQILVVLPPKETGGTQSQVLTGQDTAIIVIDILGVAK
jgi:hypothetical protein